MIKALPDQRQFESQIRELYGDGDITDVAERLEVGRTAVSKKLNPDQTAHRNPFFSTAKHLWALDSIGKRKIADEIWGIVCRARAMWLPAPQVIIDPAKSSSQIIREVAEFLEFELSGAPDDVLLKEIDDIRRAANAKFDEVLARVEARLTGQNRMAI